MAAQARSIFSRLTWASAIIGVLATALLYLAASYTVRTHTDAALMRTVDTDLAGLVDIYATSGADELKKRMADRLSLSDQGGDVAHYALSNGAGHIIAGDLKTLPTLAANASQARFVTLSSGQSAMARATRLGPELTLTVAREHASRDALLSALGWAFLMAGLGVVATMIAAGQMATRGLRGRVSSINAAFLSDQASTFPIAASKDELDDLSTHVSTILSQQKALVASHRNISDQTAHELRTPLMHLDMRLQRALGEAKQPALAEMLVAARTDIKRIIRMLESLLDIAASEAQHRDASKLVQTNLSELGISLADLFAESAEEAGLALETAIAPDVMMRCDAMQITRMLSNLLDNAIKYVPSGGTIRLSIAAGPRISVVDNGPGIAPAMRDAVFERFERAGNKGDDGHGLGLALVRAIAERHNLTARCEDAAPGAAFIIEAEEP